MTTPCEKIGKAELCPDCQMEKLKERIRELEAALERERKESKEGFNGLFNMHLDELDKTRMQGQALRDVLQVPLPKALLHCVAYVDAVRRIAEKALSAPTGSRTWGFADDILSASQRIPVPALESWENSRGYFPLED